MKAAMGKMMIRKPKKGTKWEANVIRSEEKSKANSPKLSRINSPKIQDV